MHSILQPKTKNQYGKSNYFKDDTLVLHVTNSFTFRQQCKGIREALPSTAQGKLNAVITPTIPNGFHTCMSPSINGFNSLIKLSK